jgi:hypothetical protein
MCRSNGSNELLEFVNAISGSDRLRIVGMLAARPTRAEGIASELKISIRDEFNHLDHLEQVGVIRRTDRPYALNPKGLDRIAKRQFEGGRDQWVPAPELDKKTRTVLATYLAADGSIRQIPLQAAKLRVLLNFLVDSFTPGTDYTEKEVNTLLQRFNEDTAGLRRDLVDAGLLERAGDGSRYWRNL